MKWVQKREKAEAETVEEAVAVEGFVEDNRRSMDPRANNFQPSYGGGGNSQHHPYFGYGSPPFLESSNAAAAMGGASFVMNPYSSGSGGVMGAADAYYGGGLTVAAISSTSNVGGAAYGYQHGDTAGMAGDDGGYHHHVQFSTMQQQQQQGPIAIMGGYEMEHTVGGGGISTIQQTSSPLKPGSFYPVESFQPQLNGVGATPTPIPISALAYDESYNAIFVASACKSFSRSGTSSGGGAAAAGRASLNHRASTLVTHSTTDGMLYSCVAGHPEAPAKVLNTLYGSLFVKQEFANSTNEAIKISGVRQTIVVPPPPHAYRPYYGTIDPALPDAAEASGRNYQMGISTLLPLGEGYVASVSPAGVRVHSHGGLQMADLHMEGMLHGTIHPNRFRHQSDVNSSTATHITVGGMAIDRETSEISAKQHQVFCLDVWQGLRQVTSYSAENALVAVTALAANPNRGSIIAGCNDGYTRLLDDRLRQIAKVKSHLGGVVSVAVSEDGTLFATTGYGSRCTPQQYNTSGPYCFPDMVKIYDIRYLGRGGIAHNFAGLGGGPRHLTFLPPGVVAAAAVDDEMHHDSDSHRLLVASGQSGGGMQIITPFHDGVDNASASNFILPQLERSESITALTLSEDKLGIGTSKGQLLQYRMSGYQKKVASPSLSREGGVFVPSNMAQGKPIITHQPVEKRELEMPSFEPPVPALSLEPTLLLSEDPAIRVGINDKIKSISTAYTLSAEPRLSAVGDPHNMATTSFGPLAVFPRVEVSKYQVSSNFLNNVTHAMDFLRTVPTSNLLLDLFEDHRGVKTKIKTNDTLLNPNKLLHSDKLFAIAYDKNLNRSKVSGRKNRRSADGETDDDLVEIPARYRLTNRPTHKLASTFDHAEYNKTEYIPGWDYPPTMPNAFVPPVLLLLNFIPEARNALLYAQFRDRMGLVSSKEKTLAPELGFLFHRIDTLSRNAVIFPANGVGGMCRVGAWAPTNFISCLASLPEAEQLQILDGSPAAVDKARRVEAFYRFLLYQIDKEMTKNSDSSLKVMDSLFALDFASVNEFISGSGPSPTSSTRALTVEMYYNDYINKSGSDADNLSPCFGDVLQSTLCRETRLRAWNQRSSSYETIVQRKIATSLPTLLSLSCACAGRKEEEGLFAWRSNTDSRGHWMPEQIEVELAASGNVIVRERVGDKPDGSEEWKEFRGKESIPAPVAEIISKSKSGSSPRKRRYRLEAVVSMVRDDLDKNAHDEGTALDGTFVHHVLHTRVSKRYKKRALLQQKSELETLLLSKTPVALTLVSGNADEASLKKRLEHVQQRLKNLENTEDQDEWILVNGYIVESTCSEDARAFHVKFKEPSLIVFRAMDLPPEADDENACSLKAPTEIIKSSSLTNGAKSPFSANQKVLPGKGDLIAFDAEFVSVGEESSTLTDSGSKVTVQETRHAIGRISVVDCKSKSVIFDDHVLPREPIVDYLTRFSGIVENDLNLKLSPHHLISTRTAYLKLRCLTERGCIFVGHGLNADFWMANVAVPANQIIDTVEIYHKPAQRYVSLRFLTNFVLKRDMQQDIHDSLEDATAAYELYKVALDLKEKGEFEILLDKLYEYGRKVDWKLGIEDS